MVWEISALQNGSLCYQYVSVYQYQYQYISINTYASIHTLHYLHNLHLLCSFVPFKMFWFTVKVETKDDFSKLTFLFNSRPEYASTQLFYHFGIYNFGVGVYPRLEVPTTRGRRPPYTLRYYKKHKIFLGYQFLNFSWFEHRSFLISFLNSLSQF